MYRGVGLFGCALVLGCSGEDIERESHDHMEQLTTPEAASASDRASAARDLGLTEDEIDFHLHKSAELKRVTRWLRDRSDIWVGAVVGRGSTEAPTIYVKGVADKAVHEAIRESNVEIAVRDRQPFSRQELLDRKSTLVTELRNLGYEEASAFFDIKQEGRLFASARSQAGAPTTAQEAIARLPAEYQDIKLALSNEPIDRPFSAYGGMLVHDSLVACSVGFTVTNPSGLNRGVLSAGHCPGLTPERACVDRAGMI